LQVSFGRVPFDSDDVLVGLLHAVSRFPTLTVGRGVEHRPGAAIRAAERAAAVGVHLIADVLDDHGRLLSTARFEGCSDTEGSDHELADRRARARLLTGDRASG